MELAGEFSVPVPVEQAWRVLTDVERIAPCLPGAELTGVDGDCLPRPGEDQGDRLSPASSPGRRSARPVRGRRPARCRAARPGTAATRARTPPADRAPARTRSPRPPARPGWGRAWRGGTAYRGG